MLTTGTNERIRPSKDGILHQDPDSITYKQHIVQIITGLPVGGAQTMLYHIAHSHRHAGFSVTVISLSDLGPVGEQLQRDGIETRSLGLNPARPNPFKFIRLVRWLRQLRPDLVHTWLYHADFIGGLAAQFAGVPRLLWNIRQTDLDPSHSKWHTIWTAKLCARLSRRLPQRIVCCSHASELIHAQLGYDQERMLVIGNGVDTDRFHPDPGARARLLREIGVSESALIIGLAARFHPQKDHAGFFAAARLVAEQIPEAHFVLCGEDVEPGNPTLAGFASEPQLRARVHLLGVRGDMPFLNAGFDVAVSSSSFGEGFSNSIIEAMACGTPCIVTDVGDSHRIVDDTGWRVAPREPETMAQAMIDAALCRTELARRGEAARRRVEENYSLHAVTDTYRELYLQEIAQSSKRKPLKKRSMASS